MVQNSKHKLLEAKIQIPNVQKVYLKRESLITELTESQEKLIVLHATIGYGKTVLMSQYIQKCVRFCAWYHLDILDNEVSTFVQYLEKSLKRALGDVVFDVEQYLQAEEVRVPQMTRDLVMELTEYLRGMSDRKLFLVLDDFQKLSFEKHEVYDVLYRLLSKEKADEYTKMIWENMEGWPAGVMFAALYLRQAVFKNRSHPRTRIRQCYCRILLLYIHPLYHWLHSTASQRNRGNLFVLFKIHDNGYRCIKSGKSSKKSCGWQGVLHLF